MELIDQETRERIIRVAEAIKSARVDGWFGVYEDDADELLRIAKEPITHTQEQTTQVA